MVRNAVGGMQMGGGLGGALTAAVSHPTDCTLERRSNHCAVAGCRRSPAWPISVPIRPLDGYLPQKASKPWLSRKHLEQVRLRFIQSPKLAGNLDGNAQRLR